MRFNSRDELAIIDMAGYTLSIFDTAGILVEDFSINWDVARSGTAIIPLENGNYLARRVILEDPKYSDIIVSLFDSEFNELKELHRHRVESPEFIGKFELPVPIPLFEASNERIFIGNGKLGYEILVFNPEGVFVFRKSLEVFLSGNLFEPGNPIDSWAVMKHDRFYCLREKESGFKELVVYRTAWK